MATAVIAHPEPYVGFHEAVESGSIVSPPVETVVAHVFQLLEQPGTDGMGRVVLIHSDTMFADKSRALNIIAGSLPPGRFLACQPEGAGRNVRHRTHMMDRQGGETPVLPIPGNDLWHLLAYIEQHRARINPVLCPTILIDELMLFSAQYGDHVEEAVQVIECLRRQGFNLVIAGINRAFNNADFGPMRRIAEEVAMHTSWFGIQTYTRCACGEVATVTARFKPLQPGQTERELADFSDGMFHVDDGYAPRCGKDGHMGCVNTPEGFAPAPWPISGNTLKGAIIV